MKHFYLLFLLVACNTVRQPESNLYSWFPRGATSIQLNTIKSLDPHGSYLMELELDDWNQIDSLDLEGRGASYARYQGLRLPVLVRLGTLQQGKPVFFQKQLLFNQWMLVEYFHSEINPKLP
jgi:hypothetical protein